MSEKDTEDLIREKGLSEAGVGSPKTRQMKVAKLLIQVEQVEKILSDFRNESHRSRGEIQERREKLKKRIEDFDDQMVRQVRSIRSMIRRHGTEKAPSKIGNIIDQPLETREKVVEAIQGWEDLILPE